MTDPLRKQAHISSRAARHKPKGLDRNSVSSALSLLSFATGTVCLYLNETVFAEGGVRGLALAQRPRSPLASDHRSQKQHGLLHGPTPQIRRYQEWLKTNFGLSFPGLQTICGAGRSRISIAFWRQAIWQYEPNRVADFRSKAHSVSTACRGARMGSKARQVNYARHVFRHERRWPRRAHGSTRDREARTSWARPEKSVGLKLKRQVAIIRS